MCYNMESSIDKKQNIKELTTSEIDMISNLTNKCNQNIFTILYKCFGQQYDDNKKYVISIQGSSSSGKSTLADSLYNVLVASGIECFLLHLDGYYKTTENKIKGYDFDNPAALDWDKIDNVLKAIENNDLLLPLYEYSFITKISSGPYMTKNNKPRVVIIEGIYAFNTINDKVFNVKEFDPTNSQKQIVNKFVDNERQMKFKILKVRLTLCKTKSLEVRIGRDMLQRNKNREDAIEQFNTQVWPATQNWVNSSQYREDIRIVHGSFNEEKIRLFIASISYYFTNRMISYQKLTYDMDMRSLFYTKCSSECKNISDSRLILEDDS